MKLTSVLRDEQFGNIANRVRGIVVYKLSPYEQRAFAGWFKLGFPNTIRRVMENIPIVLPIFLGTYLIYSEVSKEHARLQRKNPADFENDV